MSLLSENRVSNKLELESLYRKGFLEILDLKLKKLFYPGNILNAKKYFNQNMNGFARVEDFYKNSIYPTKERISTGVSESIICIEYPVYATRIQINNLKEACLVVYVRNLINDIVIYNEVIFISPSNSIGITHFIKNDAIIDDLNEITQNIFDYLSFLFIPVKV